MSFVRRVAYSVTNSHDAVDKIKDDMVSMGWTLHDDLSGSSPYSYVLYSNGENSDKPRAYVQIVADAVANRVHVRLWLYWDNSAHSGTVQISSDTYTFFGADDDGAFYLWVYGDGDGVFIMSKVGTTYDGVCFCCAEPYFSTPFGTLASGVSSGSDVVVTLGAGETAGFEAGFDYQLVGLAGEGRQKVTVSSVNSGSNQITISSLSYNFGAGSIIGVAPWPWIIFMAESSAGYWLTFATSGTGADTTQHNFNAMADYGYVDPEGRTQKYALTPLLASEKNNVGLFGYAVHPVMACYISTNNEDTVDTGRQDSGTSSGSNTSTTLNDTAKSWSVDGYANKGIVITGGTGSGQVRKISSNTATAITVDAAWGITPDATSTYIIADHVWRYFYCTSGPYSKAVREV